MNDLLRKSWIHLLGALFIVSSFLYLFKYTWSQGWITDWVKIALGLAIGIGCALAGLKWMQKIPVAGEIVAGMGAALLYTTFSFSGIYFALWDSMTVFICMLTLTIGLGILAFKAQLRILMNIGLLGALASPMILRPETDQVFTLFLYLLVLNGVFFILSIRQSWTELRLISFIGTWALYAIYYIQFDPDVSSFWSLPFRYALAAYIFYVLAFLISSWKNNVRFDGLNLYLGVLNAIVFGLWSMIILNGIVPYAYPLLIMGLGYIVMAFIVSRLTSSFNVAVLTKLLGGGLLLLIASTQFGKEWAAKPLINVYVWLFIACLLLVVELWKKLSWLKAASIGVWFIVVIYWFVVTWDTPWGEWFGVYIPFFNWAALAWELLAAMGFYFSIHGSFSALRQEDNRLLSIVYSIMSHLIIGGLLTVQVENMIAEYKLDPMLDLQLTLSISWGIYALLLFLWGAYSRQSLFRVFGSLVLLCVAAKTLVFDLAGSETLYKVIVLFILGIITFCIAYVNGKWQSGIPKLKNEEAQQEQQ
ncbi:DUF2339 domain-containing protein [Paenibacillus sp. UNC451MF]|uniref:DUF2339 domain-containing protein n=1 Tax=Paenibacillus sp. UNC451MF TaxID=1449063 RepID=UPI00048A90B4|nr:DUF2339 domain-containing protein [Paenibacillus sp. UNC451MF]